MITEYTRNTKRYFAAAVLTITAVFLCGYRTSQASLEPNLYDGIGLGLLMLGFARFYAAFFYLAKTKGRSAWFGLLAFVFGPVGILIVALLKDRSGE